MDKTQRYLYFLLTIIAIVIGCTHAVNLMYLNDDSFVSFRYAKNLVNGLGLVYNAEERVEGYTNFLWTILIAAGLKLGFQPELFSIFFGIIFYIGTLILYGGLSWKFYYNEKIKYFLVPLTALALCVHRDYSAHATSGMETSMFAFLISAAYITLLSGTSERTLIGAGYIFVLAMMTRPDGIVFLTATLVYLSMKKNNPLRGIFLFLMPVIATFIPYWIWRYNYFGHFFPNAFYAKSINLSYFSQGWEYVSLYFKTYYIFIFLPLLAILIVFQGRKNSEIKSRHYSYWHSIFRRDGEPQPIFLGLLFVLSYLVFIIRLGGDFMFARFLIPITPMLYFIIESLLHQFRQRSAYYILGGILVFGTILRVNHFKDNSFVGYIADEARYFTIDQPLEQFQRQANFLRKIFNGLSVRVAIWAGQLRLVYYLEPVYAIESSGGITDANVAHQPISARGRPGHEKKPTLEYLRSRKVHFYLGPTDPPPPDRFILNFILLDSIRARIITYDNSIMSRLAQYPEVKFVHLPEYLDQYAKKIHTFEYEQVKNEYSFLKPFYFDYNNDPIREKIFLTFLDRSN